MVSIVNVRFVAKTAIVTGPSGLVGSEMVPFLAQLAEPTVVSARG